jgi:hypothetical protein
VTLSVTLQEMNALYSFRKPIFYWGQMLCSFKHSAEIKLINATNSLGDFTYLHIGVF